MQIVVFAEQFRNGNWDVWEYECNSVESRTLANAAWARASERTANTKPTQEDFLECARRQFDVVRGTLLNPRNGDTRVYCVCVDKLVIGVYDKIREYSERIAESHRLVGAGMQMSA